jgi:nitrogen fixation protein NifU and related proteins
MQLTELYRDVILDHNRSPRNFGRLEPHDAEAKGHNPLCGDKLTVTLKRNGRVLEDIRFDGNGCAISMASASLMTESVKGKPLDAVEALYQRVHGMLTGTTKDSDDMGKLAALSGVQEFPARVKCASLCWHTLQAALSQADPAAITADRAVTTE